MPGDGPASRQRHPAVHRRRPGVRPPRVARLDPGRLVPGDEAELVVRMGDRSVRLTNLQKVFWPERGFTKGDLLRYYVAMAPALLPHLRDRAMVMKRYPNGIAGEFFFMKRAPKPLPPWIELCEITHGSGNVIDFPMIQDLPALLWVVNLGCIDLNQWYARCDDVDRPDCLWFDLDPGPDASFAMVRETAVILHEALVALGMTVFLKTTGSRGLHLAVPIVRGPTQDQVWAVAKTIALELASRHARVMTGVYVKARRPTDRVLVDYNQNAWGRTLASIYSVRPTPRATVSMPITWDELRQGVEIADFRLDNAPARITERGDLWKPLLTTRRRFELRRFA